MSYPLGKHAKSTTGGNTGDGYEGMYGMPGFGWTNAPQGQGLDDGGGQSYFGDWQPDSRQASKGPSRPVEQSPWDGGYYSGGGNEGPAAGQGFPGAAMKQQESARVSQKSDVPAWYRMIEPVVSNSQKTEPYGKPALRTEPYGLSGKPAPNSNDGGPVRQDGGSKRPAVRDMGWNRAGSDLDISEKLQQLREETSLRKGKEPASQYGWDAGGYMTESGREQGRDDWGARGHAGGNASQFGEGSKLGQASRIRETDSLHNSDYYSSLDARNREELSRRRDDNFTGLGRKDGFQTSSHGSETTYYRDDQGGRKEMFAARLLEKQREDSGRREDRSQAGLGHLEKREPVAKMGRYDEVDFRDSARAEFGSKLLQMHQNKRNMMSWEEPQGDWNKRDFGESAKSGWSDVGVGRSKADATGPPQRNVPFGVTRGFTMTGTSRAPPTNKTQDMRSSGGSVGTVGTKPDQRSTWDDQRWHAGYESEKGEQGLGLGNPVSIDSRLKQLSAVSQKRDAEMMWKDQWGVGKMADEGRIPERTTTFSGVDRPGVGRGQPMGALKNVGRGASGGQSGERTIGGQSQGVGRDGDGSRERNQDIGGVKNSFGTLQGAPRTPERFPGVSGLAGVGQASGGFPKAPNQNARGAVSMQNLGQVPETSRASSMGQGRGASAAGSGRGASAAGLGRGTSVRPESGARAPAGQQKAPGYANWSEAPSKLQSSSGLQSVAAAPKSSMASQRPIPSLLDMNLSFSGTKKEEQLPCDNTANQKVRIILLLFFFCSSTCCSGSKYTVVVVLEVEVG